MTDTGTLDPKAIPDEPQARAQLAANLKQRALEAKQRGELLTAMLHASDALMLMPNERDYLDLVDDIAVSTNDPLSLVPVATGAVHVATAAARARILMMNKRLDEAIEIMCEVVEVVPQIAYLDWVRRWLQPPIVQGLEWKFLRRTVVRAALLLVQCVDVPPRPGDPRVANARSAADILAAIRAVHADETVLYIAEGMLRRRLGDPAATLAVVQAGVQRFPQEVHLRTTLMNAFGDASQPDEAAEQARAALGLDPTDLAPVHDVGWIYAKAGRMQDAAAWFQQLVEHKPEYPGARAALHYTRFRAYGSEQDRNQLLAIREQAWWDRHARALANEIDPPQEYGTYLPGPGDATAAAARHIVKELTCVLRCCGAGGHVSWAPRSRYLESPSVSLAFQIALRTLGADGQLTVEVAEIQTPDPRQPKWQGPYRIWYYEGLEPRRQYPNADPRVQQAIAHIAGQLFRPEVWDPAAEQVAQMFGPDWIHAFLAVMTDPPLPPQGVPFEGFMWTYRCQIAAALVISHFGPWESGPGRPALYSIVYGPTDWVVDAAIIAFGWRTRQNPALRPEVEQLFAQLRSQIPKKGFTCWELPLAKVWLGLGGHTDAVRVDLEKWIEHYEATVEDKNSVEPPERRYGGLSLKQYAEFSMERDRIMGNVAIQGAQAAQNAFVHSPPQELVALCQRYGVPLRQEMGAVAPYIVEWDTALNENPDLLAEFIEMKRTIQLERQGVSAEEKAALDNILAGNMDMHLRMAQAQEAQRKANEGQAGDPDPVVFPGHPVARLSDYVGIMKRMQTGDMMGALQTYGLDMNRYMEVSQAWGAKMAADPMLTEKFTRMMSS